MTNIVIVAGGPNPDLSWLFDLDAKENYSIGVDRGAWLLKKAGLPLDYAVGDFDSISEDELKQIRQYAGEFEQFPPEKDDTDLELALLKVLSMTEIGSVTIFGGIGNGKGRIDHLIANFYLVYQERFRNLIEKIHFLEEKTSIRFYLPGDHLIDPLFQSPYVSVVGLTPLDRLTLKGVKYELDHIRTNHPCAYISNEFLVDQDFILSFEKGIIGVIQTIDK